MAIKFGNPEEINSIRDAVAYYPSSDLQSIDNATIPMLSFLLHNFEEFSSVVSRLGFDQEFDLLLKCPVRSPLGKGHPSMSDVMIRSPNRAASMEAVWTEPFGSNVASWLAYGGNTELKNRSKVLAGWIQYLGRHLRDKQPSREQLADVNYRMLHRAASAASMNANP